MACIRDVNKKLTKEEDEQFSMDDSFLIVPKEISLQITRLQ